MEYTVKQLAELSGVSVRTLHYYHQIGLLVPARFSNAGYRLYGQSEVDRLQQILFYRELGFALSEITALLNDPNFDRKAALQSHLSALKAQQARLNTLILTVEKTIQQETGGDQMTDSEKFEGFKAALIEENEARFGEETRSKYGDETVNQTNAKISSMSPTQYGAWKQLEQEILTELEQAVLNHDTPDGETGKHLATLHRQWLAYTWSQYSPAAHKGLAQMYVCDERFTTYYDRNIAGCAAFLRDAILFHA